MSEGTMPLPAPSREEMKRKLIDLSEGRLSPQELEAWAEQWVMYELGEVDDPVVWGMLQTFCGAAMMTDPQHYLFGAEDYRAWLDEIDKAVAEEEPTDP